MRGEFDDDAEKNRPRKANAISKSMTLQKAVDMGEYDPEFLGNFAEWHSLTRMMQWNYVRQAIKNRKRFLLLQWAEIANILDLRLKPELKEALKNIEKQQEKVNQDEERLQIDFAKG